ncbi:putative flavoprotein [Lactarius pseudohatsudake]|nr:putative flavoprotein [Lactarius pseudohatsudake]
MLRARIASTRSVPTRVSIRAIQSSARRRNENIDPNSIERVSDDVDVCIVGGGPAGLSAAIRLKQLEQESGKEVRVVVIEKGSEIGAHILSGAIIEPRALNELIPNWRDKDDHPLTQPAISSWGTRAIILSLSQFSSWLGGIAEELGVELYPGFAGSSLLYSEDGHAVAGVRLNDVGIDRKGRAKDTFEPGMEFRAKVTLLAEGARGSLTKTAIRRFKLQRDSDPQTYGFGVKEVWQVDPKQYRPGEVIHTMGWPLDKHTYGGGWVYHMADGLVSLGLVVGLDYANPYLSPYRELQASIGVCSCSGISKLPASE